MTTDARAALAQVREALATGPTPGEWRYIVDDGDRKLTAEVSGSFMCDTAYYPWCPDNEGDWKLIAACSPPNIAAILAHVEAQEAEIKRLRKFVGCVLGEARQYMSDIDGGDVQAWAVECGLLEEWTATEPCGEQCECAEVADFPTRCYRLTETGKAAIDAAKEKR